MRAATLLDLAGALLLLGTVAAAWVVQDADREVAGVVLEEQRQRSGTEFAGAAMLPAVAALAGAALAAAPPVRRVGAGGLLAAGAAGVVLVGVGIGRASGESGQLQPAAWGALAGAATVTVAGALAWRRRPAPEPALPSRYTVEGVREQAPAETEWDLAAVEDDEP